MFLFINFIIDYFRGEVNVKFNIITTDVSCIYCS